MKTYTKTSKFYSIKNHINMSELIEHESNSDFIIRHIINS